MYYYRVSILALGEHDGGGHWEDDVVVSGPTPLDAYLGALAHLKDKGIASAVTITACDENGDDFV